MVSISNKISNVASSMKKSAQKVINQENFSKAVTYMTKADSKAPIIALEAAVVGGRTIQAYNRGGKDESRERFLEEITGSIVWLWGVEILNELGDKLIAKFVKQDGAKFDVGTDKVLRTPFENFMNKVAPRNLSGTKVALVKGAKVATSIVLANLFIGFVVPKINHAITTVLRHDRKLLSEHNVNEAPTNTEQNAQQQPENVESKDTPDKIENDKNNLSFKGGMSSINWFTNAIENTNTGKLLSTDIGIAGGRMYNARNNEERREIGIRDIGSIYFYMWAQGHVRNVLNKIESGNWNRLNPETTNILTNHLNRYLTSKGGEVSLSQFKRDVLGDKYAEFEILLPKGIKFEEGELSSFDKFVNYFKSNKKEPIKVAKVSDLEGVITDPKIMDRVRKMSELQPLRQGEAVVTKQQIIDAYNVSEINNPRFLSRVFERFTGKELKHINGRRVLVSGASKDEYRYVSNESLYSLKQEMEQFVEGLCKKAKDGKINKETVKNYKNKSLMYHGINFAVGFAVAAAFLSTFIPKIQYMVTRKTTGVDSFPGTYDYEHHHEVED